MKSDSQMLDEIHFMLRTLLWHAEGIPRGERPALVERATEKTSGQDAPLEPTTK